MKRAAYWKMNGNSNDIVGSNNGTDTNISYSNSYGRLNQGAVFNAGSSSRINVGSNASLAIGTGFTFQCWIQIPAIQTAQAYIFSRSDQNNGNDNYFIGVNIITAGKLAIYIMGVSSAWFENTKTINDDKWHLITITWDTATIKMYVDGVFDNSQSKSGTPVTVNLNAYIGFRGPYPSYLQFITMYIDEIEVSGTEAESQGGIKNKYAFDKGFF